MAIAWTWSNGQFTQISSNAFSLDLANLALSSLQRRVVATGVPTTDTTKIMTQLSADPVSGQDFTLEFESSIGPGPYNVKLYGTVDSPNESLTIKPEITMGASAAPTLAHHYISLDFKFNPFTVDPNDTLLLVPGRQAQVFKWPDIFDGGEVRYWHPGQPFKGGDFSPPSTLSPVEYDEPSGDMGFAVAGHSQFVYVWDRKKEEGVLFRCTDIVGQGKVIALMRDSLTNEITLSFRLAPPDNRIGNNNASDHAFAYGLEIRPMTGEDYDACRYVAERQLAEGHPAFAKGKIKSRPSTGANYFPDKLRNALVWFSITSDGGAARDYEDYRLHAARLKSYFGLSDWEVIGNVYAYWTGSIGEFTPDQGPFVGNAGAKLAAIAADSIGVLPYCPAVFPMVETGGKGLTGAFGLINDLTRTRVGFSGGSDVPITIEDHNGQKFGAGLCYNIPNWLSDANTIEYLDAIVADWTPAAPTGMGAVFIGGYDDSNTGFPSNDDASLTSADRGSGKTSWSPKNRNRFELLRASLNSALSITDSVVTSEFPNDMTMSSHELYFDRTLGPGTLVTTRYAQPTVMYSEYTMISTIFSYSYGPDPAVWPETVIPTYADAGETFSSVYSYHFHQGVMPSFYRVFDIVATTEQWIPESGEPGFTRWFQDQEYFFDFVKRLTMALPAKVIKYRTARRLRDSRTNSTWRNFLEDYITGMGSGSTLLGRDDVYLHASLWWDETDDTMAIWLSNWGEAGKNGRSVEYEETLTTADWPELGTSPRSIFVTDARTGVRTRLDSLYDGGGSLALKQSLAPGDVLLIELETAVVYYVDATNGSDSNDGLTPDTPFQTIDMALGLWGDGDVILLFGGNSYAPSAAIVMPNNATIGQADPGLTGKPVINPGDVAFNLFEVNAVSCTIRDLTITNGTTPADLINLTGDCTGTVIEQNFIQFSSNDGVVGVGSCTGSITVQFNAFIAMTAGIGVRLGGSATWTFQSNYTTFNATSIETLETATVLMNSTSSVSDTKFFVTSGTGNVTIDGLIVTSPNGVPITINSACTVDASRCQIQAGTPLNAVIVGSAGTLNIVNSMLILLSSFPATGSGYNVQAGATLNVLNNSVIHQGSADTPVVRVDSGSVGGGMFNTPIHITGGGYFIDRQDPNFNCFNNCYFPEKTAGWRNGAATYDTLAAWQVGESTDGGSVTADPLFRFLFHTVPNFTAVEIRDGSPCIGAGFDLSGFFTDDCRRNPRSLPWDIGCHIFNRAYLMRTQNDLNPDLEPGAMTINFGKSQCVAVAGIAPSATQGFNFTGAGGNVLTLSCEAGGLFRVNVDGNDPQPTLTVEDLEDFFVFCDGGNVQIALSRFTNDVRIYSVAGATNVGVTLTVSP